MQIEQTFKLNAEEERNFERMLKKGIYYKLFADGLITDWQLAQLLERFTRGGTPGC